MIKKATKNAAQNAIRIVKTSAKMENVIKQIVAKKQMGKKIAVKKKSNLKCE